MGFLYHAHYVAYFDVARTEMMRELGLPNVEIERTGVMLPVMRVEVDYSFPAHYDDLLTVEVSLHEMPGVTIQFHYRVLSPQGKLLTTGSVTLAFMNAATKKACRPPVALLEVLRPYFT